MSSLEEYLNEPNQEDFQNVLKDVEGNAKHVLGLVEQLGPSLTSIDKDTRANATRLLADIIEHSTSLPHGDLDPLTDFFCDRVKDHHSIVPHVLSAFCSLARRPELPDASAVAIVQAIFQHAEVQTLTQQHRAVAFQTITNLFNLKLEVLTMMKETFTLGYIQMIDGEKDPRNLLTIFRLTRTVISSFPIGICCEDLFEVTACYFPVDFTPPPGVTFQISRQQLADELRAVMSSTSRFSQYCLPLLIEKISSDLQTAKQDSFHTLADCCKTYQVQHLRPFMNSLTQLLLREAMLSPSPKTEELALQAISAVCACLAAPVEGVNIYTDVDEYCKTLLKDCKHHLFEPEHKLIVPSVKVIQSLLLSNHHAANLLLTDVLPLILERVNTNQEPKTKGIYLDMMKQLFPSCKSDVTTHKELALPTVVEHIKHSNEQVSEAALQCLTTLSDSVSRERLEELCVTLLHMATESASTVISKEACSCVAALCKENTDTRDKYILHTVYSNIEQVTTLKLSTLYLLDAVVTQCTPDVCTDALQPLLSSFQHCPKDNRVLLDAILSSILCTVSSPPQLHSKYITHFIQCCVDLSETEMSDTSSQLISDIIIQLVNYTDTSALQSVAEIALEGHSNLPFSMCAVQSLLCSLPSQVIDGSRVLSIFLPISRDVSLSSHTRLSACKICSSIVNKSTSADDGLLDSVISLFNTPTPTDLTLCVWITKALVLRNHPLSQQCVSSVLDWLRDPSLSHGAASGFEVILKEYTDVLSVKQKPNIRLMYKQRLFLTVFPVLHEMLTSISPELLANVHIAVTSLVRYVPRQVISSDKQKLVEVLIKLLQSEDTEVLHRTLDLLDDDSGVTLLEQHVDTLLPILLKLCTYSANMQVRIASLKCLSSMSKLSTPLIVPHMNSVIKNLLPALDDKKRMVRKEAVRTRNIWCMIRDGN